MQNDVSMWVHEEWILKGREVVSLWSMRAVALGGRGVSVALVWCGRYAKRVDDEMVRLKAEASCVVM